MNVQPDAGKHRPRILKLIGYWVEQDQEEVFGWPDPRDLIGTFDGADRDSIITYLRSGMVFRKFLGFAHCRICGAMLGSDELTDGTWFWPAMLEHYLEVHEVRLPEDFIESAKTAGWRIRKAVRNEFASPEMWMDTGNGIVPVNPELVKAITINPNPWLDWAAAAIPAKSAPDAITFEEAKALCASLSHRRWTACIEEKFGRWRIKCCSGSMEMLIYVERCRGETLRRRLVAARYPDPDALLSPEHAQDIAREFDGEWGALRLVATAENMWLIWVNPPGKWPSDREIQEATKGAQPGWQTFRPDGSRSFVWPMLDEPQWRLALERVRAEARPSSSAQSGIERMSRDTGLPSAGSDSVSGGAATLPSLSRSRIRILWEHVRSFWNHWV